MSEQYEFKLVAGHVALDFANTLDNRFDAARRLELLADYDDFLRFCQQSGVIGTTEAVRLARLSDREKQRALRSARELREVIERLFASEARTELVDPADLQAFNAYLQKALRQRRLVRERGEWSWRWEGLSEAATGPLWPVTQAAADLLASSDHRHVRECGAETCRWLFLDISKNHSRRWCDMKICGNRSKARRYYQAHG
jgi:predicted RNA-binding Zn ribbon-like protein